MCVCVCVLWGEGRRGGGRSDKFQDAATLPLAEKGEDGQKKERVCNRYRSPKNLKSVGAADEPPAPAGCVSLMFPASQNFSATRGEIGRRDLSCPDVTHAG
mmetsp:Transcript_35271/g.83678  ORF Transcript_35271/g.83678 Transcript_35271/m.83678 type:complete len:101 (-) Transcript_35271:151-453(-)